MNIINSSVSMKLKPSDRLSLETECLFGEKVDILDEQSNWVYCKLQTDSYEGWIEKKGISEIDIEPTHRVIVKRSFIYKDKTPKSNCLLYLPMGSKVLVENTQPDWCEIKFYIGNKKKNGFVPSKHLVSNDHKTKDWVAIAQLLEGTPYRWGGRDTIGIDCSALLQLSYQTYGEIIPRNTSRQVHLNKPKIKNLNNLKRGCVIFWEGHVGIMVDRLNCIHANAFHMKTITEPLVNIVKRIDKGNHIVQMMDFN
jgi:hypothetical protein